MILTRLIISLLLLFIFSCNSNKTEEEMAELWSKAQTTGEIVNRSGTKFNTATNKELALKDAETRLQSGGGLFGKGGVSGGMFGDNNQEKNTSSGVIAMSVNPFLWRAAIETIDFMPLSSADQIGGTIITDWYSTSGNEKERCKLNIFITGISFKAENLRVVSFCQEFKNPTWVNKEIEKENNIKIENAILNKAKKLKLQSS